ncbi:MAG: hypothetical protein JWN95_3326 [Frankiales bacterium]|nr:hypothetical protein [Frankiales bacterium]
MNEAGAAAESVDGTLAGELTARSRTSHTSSRRKRLWRAVGGVLAVAVLSTEVVLVAPHFEGALDALSHPRWGWLGIALLAEIFSMVYFARIQRRMLAAGGVRLSIRRAVAVTLAANAMSVTLPAGPVLSIAYTFRRMQSWGASTSVIAWVMVASGLLSTVGLTLIAVFGAGLVSGHLNLLVLAAEVSGLLAAGFLLRELVRHPDRLMPAAERLTRALNRLRHRPEMTGVARVHDAIAELLLIKPRARDWGLGLWFALLNWLLDLVCLIAACRAVGAHGPTIGVALVAYAAGMAASSLPLVPGGIGVVDGALLLALTRGGLSLSAATAGVLVYRLISLVFVAVVGWLFWLLLNQRDRRRGRRGSRSRGVVA